MTRHGGISSERTNYRSGRTSDWLKFKNPGLAVVVGVGAAAGNLVVANISSDLATFIRTCVIYEIKPDGTVVVVTGKSEATEPNPWFDDLKVTKQ
jgi:hypothetical protein